MISNLYYWAQADQYKHINVETGTPLGTVTTGVLMREHVMDLNSHGGIEITILRQRFWTQSMLANHLDALSAHLDIIIVTLLNILWSSQVGTERLLGLERPSSLLWSQSSSNSNTDSDNGSRNTHDWTISLDTLALAVAQEVGLGENVDDLSRWRRNHVSELVGETREGGSEGWWRQLVEVDWDDSPGSLYEELHHETAGG